jgi:hypothetical protein
MKRKVKVTSNEEINECKIKSIHISGKMVESEALVVAKSLGNDKFKAIYRMVG